VDEEEAVLVKDGGREHDLVAGRLLVQDTLLAEVGKDEKEDAADRGDDADDRDCAESERG